MATIKLTKRSVEALKVPDPSGKQQLYWDAELKGFGVLVSGVSSKDIRYSNGGERQEEAVHRWGM
jgi:hypothetical protein